MIKKIFKKNKLKKCFYQDSEASSINASARRALVDWYLSSFIMCKAGHQYNERPRALALLNLPLIYTVCRYDTAQ